VTISILIASRVSIYTTPRKCICEYKGFRGASHVTCEHVILNKENFRELNYEG
jgi:hypothetical protein